MNIKAKSAKIFVLLLAFICLMTFITPTLASGHDMSHDCKGEACLICLAISISGNILRFLVILACAFAIVSILAVSQKAPVTDESHATIATPVRLKVKLSD